MIAAAIAANATREKDTGRIVLNPDMLPEIEGARSLLRDENIAAMQLSIPPERVAPLFKGGLLPADIRARVYASDGVLIVDSDQLLSRGQLSALRSRRCRCAGAAPKGVKNALDALHVMADAAAGAGLSRDRHRQRHGLPGGARRPHRWARHGDGAGHRKGEQIVSVATPIHYRGVVQGALLLSTRPGVIDEILQEERNSSSAWR